MMVDVSNELAIDIKILASTMLETHMEVPLVLKVSIFMILFVINPMKLVVFPSTIISQLPSGRVMVVFAVSISPSVFKITYIDQFSGFSKDCSMTFLYAHVYWADSLNVPGFVESDSVVAMDHAVEPSSRILETPVVEEA